MFACAMLSVLMDETAGSETPDTGGGRSRPSELRVRAVGRPPMVFWLRYCMYMCMYVVS